MKSRVPRVAPLLFASGATALVYQVTWMRQLRLIFGFSTAASAAVVAIFLGGLGLGGWLLGRRADASSRPLLFYGRLELGVAVSAAATPAPLWLVGKAYIALGGSFALGVFAGSLVRLLLSALVLSVPTVLMGGTLPAAGRAVETQEDSRRRNVAILYGVNTLGAVAGAVASTFWLLEVLGTRGTLWLACAVNAGVALVAMRLGRGLVIHDADKGSPEVEVTAPPASLSKDAMAPRRFVLAVAALVGFAFMLMELVWYRMLAPLLGGSTYTFGLILAVALAGIGLGGAAFAFLGERRPATIAGLAATCGLEAAGMALPYALGDHVALFAAFERSLGGLGFPGYGLSWIAVAALVVLPAACVAGFQFPLLVSLLGRGRDGVAKDVGLAYAWNTLGGICGCLVGGFGLLPLLSATGAWVAVVLLLAAVSACALALSFRFEGRPRRIALPLAALLASFLFLHSSGPTAAWRHSPIGAGRVHLEGASPNVVRAWERDQRRSLDWEAEGVESSVALLKTSVGFALAINGKVDGSSRGDAGTQVMGGLVGAALHPGVRRALVVGLGTGSTAGWLAAVPSVLRVDVVELEAAVRRVARDCAPVNRDVLENSKVKVSIGDAREYLLTTREHYDLIFSEPSNPYRAGISSLFTQEFYGAVRSRLAPGGIFIQWLQAYEVNSQTVRTIYATLASVFPSVETYSTKKDDLLLVASEQPVRYPVGQLRRRLAEEPFASAMRGAWGARDLEGFVAHYVARDSLARAIARQEVGRINTDDRNRVEFAFARSLGQASLFQSDELRQVARARGEDRPALDGGEVNWAAVTSQRLSSLTAEGVSFEAPANSSPEESRRAAAHASFLAGNLGQVRGTYLAGPWEPEGPLELAMLGEALADGGDPQALSFAETLRELEPAEADAIAARYLWSQGKYAECYQATASAFERYRQDPWPLGIVMQRLLAIAADLPSRDARLGLPAYHLLTPAFSVALLEEERIQARLVVARYLGPVRVAEALEALEPHFPWRRELLEERARVYEQVGNPRAELARRELEAFLRHDPTPFSRGLEAAPSP